MLHLGPPLQIEVLTDQPEVQSSDIRACIRYMYVCTPTLALSKSNAVAKKKMNRVNQHVIWYVRIGFGGIFVLRGLRGVENHTTVHEPAM
jgi:hypothetical protein